MRQHTPYQCAGTVYGHALLGETASFLESFHVHCPCSLLIYSAPDPYASLSGNPVRSNNFLPARDTLTVLRM